MADVITTKASSVKRVEKSADRTHSWLRDASENFRARHSGSSIPAIFAAIPPVDNIQQSLYLQDLSGEYRSLLSGLAIYSAATAASLPQALVDLPRICLSDPQSPHCVIKHMALGVDLLSIPFVGSCSDYGIALTFNFTGPDCKMDAPQPLGIDLWSVEHETSLLALSPGCRCLTCTRHHRAYVHHLLQAKEMLAWTLLQLHNLCTMDRFFDASRTSIANGTFEEDAKTFDRDYEAEMPTRTGLGPRRRGYQTKSVSEGKINAKPWGRIGETGPKIAEVDLGIGTHEGGDAEDQGLSREGVKAKGPSDSIHRPDL